MTTAKSPPHILKAQAAMIAKTIKDAERGEKVDARFAAKVAEARNKPSLKVGIVMDDKAVTLDIPWTAISESSQGELAEFIFGLMQKESGHAA